MEETAKRAGRSLRQEKELEMSLVKAVDTIMTIFTGS